MRNDGASTHAYQPCTWAVDDPGGGQRPGVEEHGHEGQRHRDLVADHLGRRAQRAEQRVRRPRGPAGQHDAVHADGAHGQHQQHRHRQVGELQRGAVVEDRDLGPPRDDGEGDEGGRRRHNSIDYLEAEELIIARMDKPNSRKISFVH